MHFRPLVVFLMANLLVISCKSINRSSELQTMAAAPADDQAKNIVWELAPIPEFQPSEWKTLSNDLRLKEADFPLQPNDKTNLLLHKELQALFRWSDHEDQQLKRWKEIFDGIDDCKTREKKQGKRFSSFNECIANTSLEERQFLSAKLVFTEIEHFKAETKDSSKHFRALIDKNGLIQCLLVTKKRPDLAYYRKTYKDTIPEGTKQIPALEIAYLMSAPWNLKKDDPRRISGAGSACMGLAALESSRLPWRGAIILEASPAAVPFYQKFDFLPIGETEDKDYGRLPVMWLSPSAAKKILPDSR